MNSRYPLVLLACLPLSARAQRVEPVAPDQTSAIAQKLGEAWREPTASEADLTRIFGKISFNAGEPDSPENALEDLATPFVSNDFIVKLHSGFRITENTSLNVRSGLKYRLNKTEYLTIGHLVHHALGVMYSRSF